MPNNNILILFFLSRPSEVGVLLGPNPLERRSYEVFHYLKTRTPGFSVVYFSASSGAGYYTLEAQKQGLICPKTKFVVGLDRFTKGSLEKLEAGDEEYTVTDVKTLKLDFLHQRSVELAVRGINPFDQDSNIFS